MRVRISPFWGGVCVGSLLVLVVGAIAGVVLVSHGLVVRADVAELAKTIRDRIITSAGAHLPELLARAKAGIPAVVREELAAEGDFVLTMGEFSVRIPAGSAREINAQLEQVICQSVERILDGLDLEGTIQQLGDEAGLFLAEELRRDVLALQLRFRLVRVLVIPVALEFR